MLPHNTTRVEINFIYSELHVQLVRYTNNYFNLKFFLWLIVYIDITKQLKYSIEGVSKISVSLKQTFFPRLYLGK